jgi:hypothetical protein
VIEKTTYFCSDELLKKYMRDLKDQILNDIETAVIENGLSDAKLFEIILKCRKKDILIQNE